MIQAIVEGQGEEAAFPVLLRRLLPELGCYVDVGGSPIRSRRSEIVREDDFKRVIKIASYKPNASAIVVLFDADKDCARTHVPDMNRWSQEAAPGFPCAVVMARREYEAWFLASLESLRGKRGIQMDAAYPHDPEEKQDAKGVIKSFMPRDEPYSPTADQPAPSASFDLKSAYARASSFRKLVKELCRVLEALGQSPALPPDWRANT